MAEQLPGVNFQAPLSTDDLEFFQTSNSDEIQERTRLSMRGEFGIFDTVDPRDISTTELGRPLNVLPSSNPLRVDINAGTAVTEYGNWVRLENKIFLFEMASTAVGAVNVVYIEYAREEGEDRRVNKFNVDVAVRNQRPASNEDVIAVDTIGNFLNPQLFPPSRREDIVVLAVVTVAQLEDSSLDLVIDLTDSNFSFVRPWFSSVDIRHRNMVGTADPTDTNPHGTGLNDLAAGKLTLYQQTLPHGIVLSKDVSVSKMPGAKFTETIQAASFQVDATGDITGKSALYGGAGAQYANLQHFVVRLGSVYETGFPAIQLAADFVPGESILVLPANEVIPDNGVTIEYLASLAGEAPVDPATNDLTFLQPGDGELIVTDGIAVTSIASPLISLDGSGPIPRDFRIFVDGEGRLLKSPQILLSPVKLDALVGATDIAVSMQGDAPIEIGLTRAANVLGMEVVIRLDGTDTDDQPQTEDLIFQFGEYSDTAIPAASENQQQFARSSQLFRTLETIEVVSRTNDGNDSTIIVYADQEAHVSPSFNELCPLADVFWDGLAVDEVRDARPVSVDLHLPRTPVFHGFMFPAGTRPWVFEDLRIPRYRDAFEGDDAPNAAIGTLSIPRNELFADGDTIDLGNGKILTAKIPVAATGSLGALDFGIEILAGQTSFTADDGGGPVTVNVPTGTFTLSDLATQLTNALNASALSETYTCTALSSREFTLTATGVFEITSPLSSLAAKMGFSAASGQTSYTGTAIPGLADGDLFTIGDGVTSVTFEFDTGGGVGGTNEAVSVAPAALSAAVQTAMVSAINAASFDVTASPGAGTTVDLANDNPGAVGNVPITESITTGFTLSPLGMSGGSDGGADPTVGEFNLGVDTDASTTAANIVSTLADPTFDSGVTGTAETVDGFPGVSLEKNAPGLENQAIELVLTNPSPPPVVATGFEKGTARYLGVSPDAFAEGVRTRIPGVSEDLDDIRKKYRTRALGVPVGFTTDVEIIEVTVHNPDNVTDRSIRVRAAFTDDPGNWQDYSFMTLESLNPNLAVFSFDFGAPVQKIQFELFGTFTDFAVCDVTDV